MLYYIYPLVYTDRVSDAYDYYDNYNCKVFKVIGTKSILTSTYHNFAIGDWLYLDKLDNSFPRNFKKLH